MTTRKLLLAAYVLVVLASAARAQPAPATPLVEELPGGVTKPVDWRERARVRPASPVNVPVQSGTVTQTVIPAPQPAPQTYAPAAPSQTIIIQGGGYWGGYGGYGHRGGYPGGYRRASAPLGCYGPACGSYRGGYRYRGGYGRGGHGRRW